jgi:hypothetical protein
MISERAGFGTSRLVEQSDSISNMISEQPGRRPRGMMQYDS